jgi:DNA ligase (NAD+)
MYQTRGSRLIIETMNEIEKRIIYYNEMYRKGTPVISDCEYDKLKEELEETFPDSILLRTSIIEEVPKEREEKLPIHMMSLNKTKTITGVFSWITKNNYTRLKFIISPKLDGVSILRSHDKLTWSRGNGIIGQRCDEQCSFIESPRKTTHYTRGEMIITNEAWYNNEIFRNYKHPRNTVSGWITGDFKEEIPYNLMTYVPYDLYDHMPRNKNDQLRILNSMPYTEVKCEEISEELLHELYNKHKTMYPIDGLVIEVNDKEFRNKFETNGNPSYAIAYKHVSFSERCDSTIINIRRNINRFGVITPIIEFEPINLGGATISNANGINMSYVLDWKLHPGQIITIIRSGEVIPKIVAVNGIEIPFIEDFSSQKSYQTQYEIQVGKRRTQCENELFNEDPLTKCPSCGHNLEWDNTHINLLCQNTECEGKKIQSVVDFFKIVEVDNVAEATLYTLYNCGFQNVNDILNISFEELSNVDGFAKTSAKKFISEMTRLKTTGVPLARLMHASGFFGSLGEKTIQLIIDESEVMDVKSIEKLTSIKGVSTITANAFINGINEYNNTNFNVKVSMVNTPPKIKKEGVLSNNIYCFTGCRPTPELVSKMLENGGEIVNSVTNKTTHLVVKDTSLETSKMTKARSLNIKIVELSKLINEIWN